MLFRYHFNVPTFRVLKLTDKMKNLAIISGGFSSEIIIARKSAKNIFNSIDTSKYSPHIVEITEEGWYYGTEKIAVIDKNDFSAMVNGEKLNFDLVFITIHGTPGEDGKLQGYFDAIGMPYVNSNVYASSLSFNKWACNMFLQNFGVKIAKSVFLRKNDPVHIEMISRRLGFPCFVKPNDAGSSFGVTKVKEASQLEDAIKHAFTEGKEIVIESAMMGTEVTCGAFKTRQGIFPLPPTEIVSDGDFFDFDAKYEGKSQEITPARISEKETMEVQKMTLLIYQILGLSGIARADFILQNGVPYLIEVNTTPGMSDASLIPQQVAAAGLELKQVFTDILDSVG